MNVSNMDRCTSGRGSLRDRSRGCCWGLAIDLGLFTFGPLAAGVQGGRQAVTLIGDAVALARYVFPVLQ
jgi:hypothetical protein